MISPNGKLIQFRAVSEWGVIYEWPIEFFLLLADESKTWEEFKRRLMLGAEGHTARPELKSATAGAK